MLIDREKVQEAAQKYIEKQRYDRAIAEYQKLVQSDPNDTRTLLKIGDLQTRLQAFPEAIATYDRVAQHYAAQGFSLKAIAVYKQIREIIRKHAPELADRYGHIGPRLAEIYTKLGLASDALAAWDEVATRLQRAGRDREAIETFRSMVELDGKNPLPHLRLAEAYCRVQSLDEAIESFWTAAEMLIALGRREDAVKVVERILHFRSDARFARVCAELYLERGTREDALSALAKLQICFQADPRNLDTLELLARAFLAIGQEKKAIEVQKEMALLARDVGRVELYWKLVTHLRVVAPEDEQVRAFESMSPPARSVMPPQTSIPDLEVVVSMAPPSSAALSTPPAVPVAEAPPAAEPEPPPRSASQPKVPLDAPAHARKAIADAESFRRLRLYRKAIGTLYVALEVDPGSLELRDKLREILQEAGRRDEMIVEALNVATLYLERGQEELADPLVREVLELSPGHEEALGLLELIAPSEARAMRRSLPQRDAASEPPQEQAIPEDRPLPSYDLEEVGAGLALGSSHGITANTRPKAVDAMLPEHAGPESLGGLGSLGEIEEIDDIEEIQPSTMSGNLQSLEDALEEADFFSARGLYQDALNLLDEQIARAPKNRLLLDKQRELRQLALRGPGRAVERKESDPPPSVDEALGPAPRVSGERSAGDKTDAEQVFAQFRANIRTEVSESDSATHYDLALAYKEMGLLPDAVHEFELAARDPQRESMCFAMIAGLYRDRNDVDRATAAYRRALEAERKTTEQELGLLYELGRLNEQHGRRKDALECYELAARLDPEYRDLDHRMRTLQEASGTRSVGEDDEVERAFDDLFESK